MDIAARLFKQKKRNAGALRFSDIMEENSVNQPPR